MYGLKRTWQIEIEEKGGRMPKRNKITPHLWYDSEASAAARLYVTSFDNSRIISVNTIKDTPSGDAETVEFELGGYHFASISAGPYFKFNPSVSFLVSFSLKDEVDRLFKKLSRNGKILMEPGSYPFSERYCWIEDRYGLSWQLMYSDKAASSITPVLMFSGGNAGKCEEAIGFYTSVFGNSKTGDILRYSDNEQPDTAGTIKHAGFTLEGSAFAAMDSARVHDVAFNEAVSFIVDCDTQDEIDHYWNKLSAVPEAEQCGWLKDRYGLSWQVVPSVLGEMMSGGDRAGTARVTEAFLKMKKFDIELLKKAYSGR
jgi:predicted 3-demethylubiquinone-9 3-methyltransferase (glyoxalase superfamily)